MFIFLTLVFLGNLKYTQSYERTDRNLIYIVDKQKQEYGKKVVTYLNANKVQIIQQFFSSEATS